MKQRSAHTVFDSSGRLKQSDVSATPSPTSPSARTVTYENNNVGGQVSSDGEFLYQWDEKGRLTTATEKPASTGTIRRVRYFYDGNNRMVGRRAENASLGSLTDPLDTLNWQLETRSNVVAIDGLPAETTFVWDPIADTIVSVFDAGPGGTLLKQIIHGGMGYDDPIEVTTATKRFYPVYDEAGDGNLQVVFDDGAKLIARNLPGDPYGAEALDIAGAAVDHVEVHATKDGSNNLASVEVTVHATETLAAATVAGGLRLATIDAASATVATAPAPAQVVSGDAYAARFTLTVAQWTALTTAAGAQSLSVGVTPTLRAAAWSSALPILPPPDWAQKSTSVYSSTALPVEVRDSLSALSTFVAGISAGADGTRVLYNVENLSTLGTAGASGTDDPIEALLAARFQAQPFAEPFTRKFYVRERWLDPLTGTWLSPDPVGYRDSANLYSYCAGDPVNGRDPLGREVEFLGDEPERRTGYRDVIAWIDNPEAKEHLRYNPKTHKIDIVGMTEAEFVKRFDGTAAGRLGELIKSKDVAKVWAVMSEASKKAKIKYLHDEQDARTGKIIKGVVTGEVEAELKRYGGGVTVPIAGGSMVLYDRNRLPAATLMSNYTPNVVQTVETTVAHELGGHAYQNIIGFKADTGVITVSSDPMFGVDPGEAMALYSENLYRMGHRLPPRKKYKIPAGDWDPPADIKQWFRDLETGGERPTPGYPNVFEKP